MRKLLRRLHYWIHQRRIERQLQEEIELHRSMRQEELERSGLSSEEAATRSRHALGNALLSRENARGVWISPWLDQLWQDIRYGMRQLRKDRGFTAIAVLTLAIGIGATSAVFSMVNGILLEQLPFKEPQQLVLMSEILPNAPAKFGVSPPDFEFLRNNAQTFAGMAAYRTVSYELSGVAESQRLTGARVSPELFSLLGVSPVLGRAFTEDDNRQQSRVAVIGEGLWTRAFGRDPSIIGRAILLDRQPYTVVGIVGQAFVFPPRGPEMNGEPADVFTPIAFSTAERQGFGMFYNNTVVARLKPGASIEQARAELVALAKSLVGIYPPVLVGFMTGLSVPVVPFSEELVSRSRRLLFVLMATVGVVLLIGCADVANLILTRSGSRQRDIAIRSSLGAGPVRIVRQLLTEALLLAAAGGMLGLFLARFSIQAFLSLAGQTLPRMESVTMNYRVIAFTAAAALVTPLLFAALPALRAAFAADAEVLKHNTTSATPTRGRFRLLGLFAVSQIALALILSVGAGLLVRSFLLLSRIDPGFHPEQVVRLTATLPSGKYPVGPPMRSFYQRALESVRRIPGVLAAGEGNDLPLSVRERRAFSAQGNTRQVPQASRLIAPTWITPGYFEALGIPLKRGRVFTDSDNRNSQPVVIVNEVMARMLWPDADPIGNQIKWGIDVSQAPWMTIVGVAGDVKQSTLDTPTMAQAYVPFAQEPLNDFYRTLHIAVRSNRDADSLMSDLRISIRGIDPDLPVKVQPITEMVGESLKPQRFSMTLVMLFAGVALLLSTIGIYGVLANVVSQQTQEIGVRIALGATPRAVIWIVFHRALIMMVIGLAIGIAGAFAATRLMSGLLYEVRPTDATAFLGAAASLAVLALAASLVPAWRATRVDPLIALKTE
jgi:putative ABC transport system permease protein